MIPRDDRSLAAKMFTFDFNRASPTEGEVPSRTGLFLVLMAMALALTFGAYAAARLSGADPAAARGFARIVDGAILAAALIPAAARKRPVLPLLVLAAATAVFTGMCFTICQAGFSGADLLLGSGAMLVGALTLLFKNIDERVPFMVVVLTMLGTLMVLLFSLG